ncbi:MAG: winged helix family two component transcriptional regulator [Bacteroidetes bacterium]|nr:MAG: winged helix family two component transcriptional regulator [Bacteroidota bacterium]
MKTAKPHILLVEDDLNLGYLLTDVLELHDFTVKLCRDGESGMKAFETNRFDLCLLDVMLPVQDGFTLAKKIKAQQENIPVVFLTARSVKDDKLKGFDIGADDYITKPFEEEELVARLRAVLRRVPKAQHTSEESEFAIGHYRFDHANQLLIHAAGERRITERESQVLRMLCLNRNRILKRNDLLKSVWGDDDYFMGRSLDVFIAKLRKYLKDDPAVSIENVHGVGFMLKTV